MAAHPDDRARAGATAPASIGLTVLLAVSALVSTAILIFELVTGSQVTSSADSLLASGTLVRVGNALVFGLLYWQLDSGDPSPATGRFGRTPTSPSPSSSSVPSWRRRIGALATWTTSCSA